MSKPIAIDFTGDASGAVKAFDNVGESSKRMASKVDESAVAHTRLGERVGGNEQKFMGAADLLDGLGGAFGLPTEGATKLMRSFSDLSGGFEIVSGIMPGLTSVFPRLAGAMTFVSAHPLMVAFLVGGAIIAGLILLEKKFGVVSGAVKAMGDAFMWAWDHGVKPAINFILGGVESMLRGIGRVASFGGILNPFHALEGLRSVSLPRLDVGGTILQTGIAVVHRGETVSPVGSSPSSSAGGAVVNVYVGGSVVSERDLVESIHEGLMRKQSREGSLGFRAA